MVTSHLTLFILTCVSLSRLVQVSGQSYVAEGYFVVDDETVKSYIKSIPGTATDTVKRAQAIAELQKDVNYVLSEANSLFKSLNTDFFKLELKLRALEILNVNVIPASSILTGTSNGVRTNDALTQFENWLQNQNSYNSYKYDFAILWTGYDLFGPSGSLTAGFAHIGEVCDPKIATGVVEFDRTYHTAVTTAHEIAHILGADHGGAASTHIMSSSLEPTHRNRWLFSNCSRSDIQEYIATLLNNCLLTTNSASSSPTVTYGQYTGQILDPNTICQRSTNKINSYMCLPYSLYNNSAPSGDKVCSQIFCAEPGTSYCSSAFSSEGMTCDSGKRCKYGKCSQDITAPINIDSNCVYGNQKVLELTSLGYSGTCQNFLTKYGASYCNQITISQRCCSSCKAYYTGRTGCEYGDKSQDCVKYPKNAVCPTNRELCCNYCYGFVGKRSIKWLNAVNITLSDVHGPDFTILSQEYFMNTKFCMDFCLKNPGKTRLYVSFIAFKNVG
ncbi:hypothetical protein Btru_013285 [Bulinus truncatus]|nr:hypothetical protein Btru_013285 [Bulinus truncatus]